MTHYQLAIIACLALVALAIGLASRALAKRSEIAATIHRRLNA